MPQCRREKVVADGVEQCLLEHKHRGRHEFYSDGRTTGTVTITAKFKPGIKMQALRDWLKVIPDGAVKKIRSKVVTPPPPPRERKTEDER